MSIELHFNYLKCIIYIVFNIVQVS